MVGDLIIQSIENEEKPVLLEWFQKEGWNPGLQDVDVCSAIQTSHFFVGHVDGKPVSCLSAVVYELRYAFIGYYVVMPSALRGKGYGLKTWDYTFDFLQKKGVTHFGLDGVLEQTGNYEKYGFESSYLHKRYCYEVTGREKKSELVSIEKPSHDDLVACDAQYLPESRPAFIQSVLEVDTSRRHGLVRDESENIIGYSCIRQATEGYRIGPVYCKSPDLAVILVESLCSGLKADLPVYLDLPAVNSQLSFFIEKLKLRSINFDCMRMYKGGTPSIPLDEVYAVTHIEMG